MIKKLTIIITAISALVFWNLEQNIESKQVKAEEISVVTIPCTVKAKILVDAAYERTTHRVRYDGKYIKLSYPGGDVPDNTGVCTDLIIRCYRKLGIDLQKEVHEDMKKHFPRYPEIWGLKRPDKNIDHRRVPNLQSFFNRHGEVLPISNNANDYKPSNLVTWIF